MRRLPSVVLERNHEKIEGRSFPIPDNDRQVLAKVLRQPSQTNGSFKAAAIPDQVSNGNRPRIILQERKPRIQENPVSCVPLCRRTDG